MTAKNQSRQQLETSIIERASQDSTFRQALISDPKAALADFLGMSLSPNVTITVLEEQAGQHYLVLPSAPPSLEAMPLDDLELALVGGGRTMRPLQIKCNGGRGRIRRGQQGRRGSC